MVLSHMESVVSCSVQELRAIHDAMSPKRSSLQERPWHDSLGLAPHLGAILGGAEAGPVQGRLVRGKMRQYPVLIESKLPLFLGPRFLISPGGIIFGSVLPGEGAYYRTLCQPVHCQKLCLWHRRG